jgi:hypothetical protein
MRGRPRIVVDDDVAAMVRHGRVLERQELGLSAGDDGPWAVVDREGELLAVYIAHRGASVKPGAVVAG